MNNQEKRKHVIALYQPAIDAVLNTFHGYLENYPKSDIKEYCITDIDKEIKEFCDNLDAYFVNEDITKYETALHHKLVHLESWEVRITKKSDEELIYWDPTEQSYKEFSKDIQAKNISISWSDDTYPPKDIISRWISSLIKQV